MGKFNVSDDTILHSLSGGIDSTNVLYQLVEQGKPLLIHHLNIKTDYGRWEAEQIAIHNILSWFENRGVKLKVLKSCEISGIPRGMFDIEIVGFIAGGILRRYDTIKAMTFSTSLTDREQPTWQSRQDMRVQLIKSIAGRDLDFVTPNWEKSREQVIRETPKELLQLCSFCRRPYKGDDGIAFVPCGECKTCDVTVQYL